MIKHQFNKGSGFTLIELLIAVALIGILGGVLVQAVTGKSPKSDCLNAGGSWTEGCNSAATLNFAPILPTPTGCN